MLSCLAMMSGSYGYGPGNSSYEALVALVAIAFTGLLYAVVALEIPYLLYRMVTIPLRRQERARLFLDIVETCARQGKSVEEAIVSLAETQPRPGLFAEMFPDFAPLVLGFLRGLLWFILPGRDDVFGGRLTRLADRLAAGVPLADALAQVPGIVPAHVGEMLRVGGETGDLLKVLPACRKGLTTAASRVRGAMSYVVLFTSGCFFVLVAILYGAVLVIVPKFSDMARDMRVPGWGWVRDDSYAWRLPHAAAALAVLLILFAISYIAGSRLNSLLRLGPLTDRLAFLLPWRRMALQRDFSAMLAVLLDGGVPEARAVEMAARATANRVLVRRGKAAVEALGQGRPLIEALARIDGTGELKWRLANAVHRNAGFLDALAGWHGSLDAKAFQAEQAAAHVITTLVVVANGVIVGLFAIGLFQFLVGIEINLTIW